MEASSFLLSHSLAGVFFPGNRTPGDIRLLGRGEVNSSLRRRNLSRPLKGSSVPSPMALGSNAGADTDDMYDDLFKKYGKVVYKRKEQKSPTAEVDDDAKSLSFAVAAAKVASDVKAADIKIDAIGSKIKDLAEEQYGRVAIGDTKPNTWTLYDFGDVVVHIFLPPERAFYNLEEFYANATPIDLPFENQPPFHG